jgi:hypothetical protein
VRTDLGAEKGSALSVYQSSNDYNWSSKAVSSHGKLISCPYDIECRMVVLLKSGPW